MLYAQRLYIGLCRCYRSPVAFWNKVLSQTKETKPSATLCYVFTLFCCCGWWSCPPRWWWWRRWWLCSSYCVLMLYMDLYIYHWRSWTDWCRYVVYNVIRATGKKFIFVSTQVYDIIYKNDLGDKTNWMEYFRIGFDATLLEKKLCF